MGRKPPPGGVSMFGGLPPRLPKKKEVVDEDDTSKEEKNGELNGKKVEVPVSAVPEENKDDGEEVARKPVDLVPSATFPLLHCSSKASRIASLQISQNHEN